MQTQIHSRDSGFGFSEKVHSIIEPETGFVLSRSIIPEKKKRKKKKKKKKKKNNNNNNNNNNNKNLGHQVPMQPFSLRDAAKIKKKNIASECRLLRMTVPRCR